MASSLKQRSTTRKLLGSLTGLILALSGVFAVPAASADIPGTDEIVTSPNVKHLANVPKQGPFAGPNDFGTDIAFTGRHAIAGNYTGFVIYDISRPNAPTIVSQVSCPGSQNDVSVAANGTLLFLSTDSSRSDDSCQSTTKPVSDPTAWEGIKIFDISDKANPRYIKSVETQCGSHTHTLIPGKRGTAYLYVSSYILPTWLVGSPNVGPDCQEAHDKISIVKVPLSAPTTASVVATPVLFPDGGNPGNPGRPDNPVPGDDTWVPTTGCHDITAYPEKDIAAGACMGDGALFDISNPERPKVITTTRDTTNFAFWHSATFNQRANKVVFTDELGGGVAATCNPTVGPLKGANGIYDIVGKGSRAKLVFRGY